MKSFKKGLSYVLAAAVCGMQVSCKTDVLDYSYLENVTVQVPKNIMPVPSETTPSMVKKGIYERSIKVALAKEYQAGIHITQPVQISVNNEDNEETEVYVPVDTEKVLRVGVLLPLSGKVKDIGEEMQNAAIMALEDTGSDKVILQFYDTKGEAATAKTAIKTALNEGAELIIGPLFSAEVKAVSEEVQGWSVPVISFSSDNSVLGENIYSVALLVTEQVHRIVSYACDMGYKNLAVLAQSNEMGEYAFAAAKQVMESEQCNGAVVKMGFYNPKTTDFSSAVKEIMPKALLMKIEKEKLKKQGVEVVEETLYDENGNVVDEKNIPFDFDSVLVVDEGAKLRSLGALLSYYDVSPNKVKILGISMMDDAKVKKEAVFNQAWYAALPKSGFETFSGRYKKLFNEQKPSRIVSLVYDAVSLAAYLAEHKGEEDMHAMLLSPSGFSGIEGLFRLLPDGRVERATAVMQVRKYGADKEIVPPVKQFSAVVWERVENEKPSLTVRKEENTDDTTEQENNTVKNKSLPQDTKPVFETPAGYDKNYQPNQKEQEIITENLL